MNSKTIGLFLFILLVGCAGLTHHKNDAALKQVRKVAVVGFMVDEPTPNKIGLNLNSGEAHAVSGIGGAFRKHPAAETMYAELQRHFADGLHWQVVPAAKMKANAGYQKAFEATMHGFHNRMPPGSGRARYVAEGVMDDQSCRLLDTAGRTALIKALGVDAIVSSWITIEVKGTTVMGIGSSHPQAHLAFQVYTADKAQDDWFEGDLAGEESKENVGMFFGIDELNRLAMPSVRSALAQIGRS